MLLGGVWLESGGPRSLEDPRIAGLDGGRMGRGREAGPNA